ncbi:MAG: DegV family protein [Clostridia bacterium]|nr:DegV family protein [Clostridia bacterium]
MKNYVIITDSGCDLSRELLAEWGVISLDLSFRFEGDERIYHSSDMEINKFYNKMREGGVAKTMAINPETFANEFEKALAQGKDVIYLGFSSGLSTTFNSAQIAASDVLEQYPDRKVVCVDSLCASAGQGLFVYLVAEKSNSGADFDETVEYARSIVPNICHWFTVDDLVYLKRGGRVSPAVALVGKVLGIKPVLHVDNEGKLVSMSKARGRKAALIALADKYGELANPEYSDTVFISNADCMDDVKELEAMIKSRFNANVKVITDIGAVIGAHAGPGTIALFFVAKER